MKLKCEFCGKRGHVKKGCFQLNGFLDWWKGPTNGKLVATVVKDELQDEPTSNYTEEGSSSQNKELVNSIVQEVVKMMSAKQGNNLDGFAGTYAVSNVLNVFSFLDKDCWIIDSGASDQIAGNKDVFDTLTCLNKGFNVGLPDGTIKHIKHVGTVILSKDLTLNNVLYMPDFKHNLLSLSKLLEDKDLDVLFFKDQCIFQDRCTKNLVGVGKKIGGLYKLILQTSSKEIEKERDNKRLIGAVKRAEAKEDLKTLSRINKIHVRLGHCSLSKLKHLNGCNWFDLKHLFCDTCNLAKIHRQPFVLSNNMASIPFELVHMDLWGPYKITAISGAKYLLRIVDDNTRVTWTHLLASKDQVQGIIKGFLLHVETQFEKKVKKIRSDNGTEILNEECTTLFQDKGIVHQRSIPKVPQQNGRVERKHRHLIETARSIKIHVGLPKYLWGECVLASTHIINLMPTVVLGWTTPYEKLFGEPPSYDHLKVIGCLCYGIDASKKLDKFEAKGVRSVLVGYPYAQKGYTLYDLEKKRVYVSRDVLFEEDIFPFLVMKPEENALKLTLDNLHERNNFAGVGASHDDELQDAHIPLDNVLHPAHEDADFTSAETRVEEHSREEHEVATHADQTHEIPMI